MSRQHRSKQPRTDQPARRLVKQAKRYGHFLLKEGRGLKESWRIYRTADGKLLATIYPPSLKVLILTGAVKDYIQAENLAHALLLVHRAEKMMKKESK